MTEAIRINQQMITEWMQECKQDNYLAYCMLIIDEKRNIKIFRTETMNTDQLIRNMQFVIDNLKKIPPHS